MTTWTKQKLGDLISIKHGYAFKGEFFGETGSHIVLTPGNFFEKGGFRMREGKEKWYDGPIDSEYVLKKDDLIIAMTEQGEGLLGSSALIPRDGLFLHNQRIGLVSILDSSVSDKRFLYYLFNTKVVRQQIRGTANGAKVRHTSPKRVYDVSINLPKVEIQKEISSIIATLDDLIENNEKRIKILEEMAQRLYTEWFVKFKFPGHEKVKMVDSGTDFGVIPEGWIITTFGKIMELKYGKALKSENRKMGKYPVFGSSGIVGFNNVYLVKGPGIVIGRKGNAGSVHWVKSNFFPIDTTYYIASDIDLIYCYYLLKNFDFITGDVAIPGLNRTQTNLSEVLFPSEALITRFIDIVRPLRLYIAALESKNSVLSESRDLLISQLVTGKRELKN